MPYLLSVARYLRQPSVSHAEAGISQHAIPAEIGSEKHVGYDGPSERRLTADETAAIRNAFEALAVRLLPV